MAFRTKKISQMDPKGANLASTDLLEISELVSGSYVTKSITGAEIIASVPASVTAWGTITGTLSAQTDLNTALSGKVPTTRTISTTAPLSGGGDLSANRTLSIATANTTTTGALSSTDWNTFNGKQPLLVSGTNIKTINGTTLLGSGDLVVGGSSAITIGTTAITSGTVGRVLFQGTGNVVQQSTNLFWDNTNNRLGIGTSSPAFPLDVTYNDNSYNLGLSVRNTNTGTTALIGYSIYNSSNVKTASFVFAPSNFAIASLANTVIFSSEGSQKLGFIANSGNGGTAQDIYFSTSGGNSTYQIQIKGNTGNVQIGTNTDAGFKLDVNGTARVSGTLNLNSSVNIANNNQFSLNYINFSAVTANQGIASTFSPNGTPSGYAYNFQFSKSSTANGNGLLIIGGGSSSGGNASNKHVISTSCYGSGTGQPLVLRTATTGQGFDSVNDHLTIFPTGNVVIQNVALSATDIASSKLTIESTTQGFLPPRMTTTQKNAIASPATGLMVYDTTLNVITYYNGTTWI